MCDLGAIQNAFGASLRRRGIVMIVLLAAFFSASLLADEVVIKQEDKVVYEKKTVINFDDVLIEGELMKPEGTYVKNRRRTAFDSLIELRSNFRPELLKSASEL